MGATAHLTPVETDHPRKTITEPTPDYFEDEELPPTYNEWETAGITVFDGLEPPVVEVAPKLASNVVALSTRTAAVTFQPDDADVDSGEDRSADNGLDVYG